MRISQRYTVLIACTLCKPTTLPIFQVRERLWTGGEEWIVDTRVIQIGP